MWSAKPMLHGDQKDNQETHWESEIYMCMKPKEPNWKKKAGENYETWMKWWNMEHEHKIGRGGWQVCGRGSRRQRSRKAVWEESVKREGEEMEREEKQAGQGRMGRGDGSADDNLWEEKADVTGHEKKMMTLFVLMDRYSVLSTHTGIKTPQVMKDKNKR